MAEADLSVLGLRFLPWSAPACSVSLEQLAFVPVEHGNSSLEGHPGRSHLSHLVWFLRCTQRYLTVSTRLMGPSTRPSHWVWAEVS